MELFLKAKKNIFEWAYLGICISEGVWIRINRFQVGSVILYFAPIMGLFGLDAYYESGKTSFTNPDFVGT